jgi:hypothetical protein
VRTRKKPSQYLKSQYLKKVRDPIFEEQLNGGYRVLASWPNRRDPDIFGRWIEWSFHSIVVHLCDGPLLQEEV